MTPIFVFGHTTFNAPRAARRTKQRLRPHCVESGSRPITDVKQGRALSVLGWGTWEYLMRYNFILVEEQM